MNSVSERTSVDRGKKTQRVFKWNSGKGIKKSRAGRNQGRSEKRQIPKRKILAMNAAASMVQLFLNMPPATTTAQL